MTGPVDDRVELALRHKQAAAASVDLAFDGEIARIECAVPTKRVQIDGRQAHVTFAVPLPAATPLDLVVTPAKQQTAQLHRTVWSSPLTVGKPFTAAMEQRRVALRKLPAGRRKTFATWFHDLDRKTLTPLLREMGKHGLAKKIEGVVEFLRARTQQRAWFVRSGLLYQRTENLDARFRKDIVWIERLLHPMFERLAQDADAVWDCFTSFVDGDLVLTEPTPGGNLGGPDGAHYFAFAEFAFVCVDLGLPNAAFWKQLAAVFVATEELFVDLYWRGGRRVFANYGHGWKHGSVGPDRWAQQRAHFASLDADHVQLIHGEIAARALRDELANGRYAVFLVQAMS